MFILLLALLLLFPAIPVWTEGIAISLSNSPAMLGVLVAIDELGVAEDVEDAGSTFDATSMPQAVFHRSQSDAVVRLVRGDVVGAILPVYIAARVHRAGTPLQVTHAVYGTFLTIVQVGDAPHPIGGLEDLLALDPSDPLLVGKQAGPLLEFPRIILARRGLDGVATTGATAAQISQMLLTGQAHQGVLREPLATHVVRRSPGARRAVDLQQEWLSTFGMPMVQAAIVFRRDFLEEQPRQAAALLAAIDAGYATVATDPAHAATLAGRLVPGLDAQVVREALPVMGMTVERVSGVDASAALPGGEQSPRDCSAAALRVAAFLELLGTESPGLAGEAPPDEAFYGQR
jgi:hypothetical protein